MALPYNADTALDPKTWLPGGEAVPSSGVAQAAYPGPRVLVSGAGTESANGVYTFNVATDQYEKADGFIYLEGGNNWVIAAGGTDFYASGALDPVVQPWEAPGYTAEGGYSGELPVPDVTEFPA